MASRTSVPDYGIDAPGLVRFFLLAGLSCLALATLVAVAYRDHVWALRLVAALFVPTIYLLGMGGFMLFESKVTKVRGRERLLDLIDWTGDEAVLDVGCGRGLMMVGAARRLATGTATGVDIWQASDQSSNTAGAALDNARREGVEDRVAVITADMRALPFADRSFDVVVSHWAVHNIAAEADRDLALAEMARVLRPGGHVVLADIGHRRAYAARFLALGLSNQRTIVSPVRDIVLGAVSFGSFRPFALLARSPVPARP